VTIECDRALETIGDPFRLQQVIGALVANALAYTDPDTEIRLSASRADNDIEVTIADTGPGLEADDAARVFDRFFRGEQSRARRTGGSGLGLAIARSIVEAHHGTITLHTTPGDGCRFAITLPNHTPPTRQAPTNR
jgi:signal transduction histidine kinase